jgi:hypothetical protein
MNYNSKKPEREMKFRYSQEGDLGIHVPNRKNEF